MNIFFWNFVFKELSQMLWNAPGIFWFASKLWVSHHFCWKNTIFKIQPKTLLTLTFLKSLKVISKCTFRSFIWGTYHLCILHIIGATAIFVICVSKKRIFLQGTVFLDTSIFINTDTLVDFKISFQFRPLF